MVSPDSPDSPTFNFVNGLARLVCAHALGPGWRDGNILPHVANPNQLVGGFRDTGFRDKFRDGTDQVSHFVAFLQAGYYAGIDGGIAYLLWHERDAGANVSWTPDYKLGDEGVWCGVRIRQGHAPWPGSSFGLAPSEVGDWIRKNLGPKE